MILVVYRDHSMVSSGFHLESNISGLPILSFSTYFEEDLQIQTEIYVM